MIPTLNRDCQLQSSGCGSDNRCMPQDSQPFLTGAMVVVTLGNPRDKFWGMILALAPEGLSLSGIELASFEDFIAMVKDGESFSPAVVFFPMHRIERIELDLPDGSLLSLSQRFLAKTGRDPAVLLGSRDASAAGQRGGAQGAVVHPAAVHPAKDPA
jgi:hypothetical protein